MQTLINSEKIMNQLYLHVIQLDELVEYNMNVSFHTIPGKG